MKKIIIILLILTCTIPINVNAATKINAFDRTLESGIYNIKEKDKFDLKYSILDGIKSTLIVLDSNYHMVFKSSEFVQESFVGKIDSTNTIIIIGEPIGLYFEKIK